MSETTEQCEIEIRGERCPLPSVMRLGDMAFCGRHAPAFPPFHAKVSAPRRATPAVPERGEEETDALAMRLDGLLETAGSHETIPVRVSLLRELRKALAHPTPEGEDARRTFTYRDQPGNVEAWRLGVACSDAVKAPAGDPIDRGLVLLRELEAQGFGVVRLASTPTRSERDGE